MCFFDTHAHLDLVISKASLSLDEVVKNAQKAKVNKILLPAIFAKNFENVTAYCQQFPEQLVYGLGLHPYFVEQHKASDLILLESKLAQKKQQCVAVAEIGLDKRLDENLWKKQCDFFVSQLELARQYNLPVSLHSVKTHSALYFFLKQFKLPKFGIIHAFSGSYQQAKSFVDLGYKIGVGGLITYERANKTRQAIAKLPLDSFVLETDSPDMPLCGSQGGVNLPENIPFIFECLCNLRNEDPQQIINTIWKTSNAVFKQ